MASASSKAVYDHKMIIKIDDICELFLEMGQHMENHPEGDYPADLPTEMWAKLHGVSDLSPK